MDASYVHIAINHLPIIGIFIGTSLLVYGVIANYTSLKHAGLSIMLLTALCIIPVYFSGAIAKSQTLIAHPEKTSEIFAHGEMAITAVWLTLIAGR